MLRFCTLSISLTQCGSQYLTNVKLMNISLTAQGMSVTVTKRWNLKYERNSLNETCLASNLSI